MAQPLIRQVIVELDREFALPEPVFEFGSMQVEDHQENDLRPLFHGRRFIGTDIRHGPGVDRIEDLRSLTLDDDEAGTVLCLDTLEHCQDPVAACRELSRVTGPLGVAVISSVMLFGVHGYPNDYFRFTPEGFRLLLEGFDKSWVGSVGDPEIPFVVIGIGANGNDIELPDTFPSVAEAQAKWESASREVRVGPLRYPPKAIGATVAKEYLRLLRGRLRR